MTSIGVATLPRTAHPTPARRTLQIGFVADDLYPGFGGQARATEGHIRGLVARGHRVRALAGSTREPSAPPAGVAIGRVPALRLGGIQMQLALPLPAAVAWLVQGSDVVHVNTPTPLAVATCLAARRAGVPCVVGIHTQIESATLHLPGGRPAAATLLRLWYRAVFARADALVAPTAFAARTARPLTARPIHVVSNGVEIPEETVPRDAARRRLARRIGLPPDGWLLLYVGRLAAEKRPQDLLDLLARLPARAHLAVAGEGPMRNELERRAAALGLVARVTFLGYVGEEEKRLLLAGSDLFLMPSPTELQSIATLEALAHGCVVAAAGHPTSAVPDLLAEVGGGCVYDGGDPERAAHRIAELLADDDRRRTLAERGRAGVRCHALATSAATLEEVYRSLLGARQAA